MSDFQRPLHRLISQWLLSRATLQCGWFTRLAGRNITFDPSHQQCKWAEVPKKSWWIMGLGIQANGSRTNLCAKQKPTRIGAWIDPGFNFGWHPRELKNPDLIYWNAMGALRFKSVLGTPTCGSWTEPSWKETKSKVKAPAQLILVDGIPIHVMFPLAEGAAFHL